MTRWRHLAVATVLWGTAIGATAMQARADQSSILAEISIGPAPGAAPEHVFGGRSVSLSVTLYGAREVRADLKARLFQLSHGLVVPAGEFHDIAAGVDFRSDLRRRLAFDVALPAVERESRFEVVVFGRVHPSSDWRRIGSASLRAYPDDLLAPLKRWSQDRPLRLHDPSGKLERFLSARGIAFVDPSARSLEKSDDAVTLLVGGAREAVAPARRRAERGEAVIVFRERVIDLPRIERTHWQRGVLVLVELELLDSLPVDPQAQKLLLELITSTRTRETSAQEEN
jgi:hypothetical protein